MRHTVCWGIVGALTCLAALAAAARDCSQLPAPKPKKSFVGNFANSCYAINFGAGGTAPIFAGDQNAIYDVLYYRIDPRYELVILGAFPHVRYFSITAYDDHEAMVGSRSDHEIVPLTGNTNPFQPGVAYLEGQKYVAVVSFGGVEPPPEAITPGCALGDTNARLNLIDVSMRHQGLSWDGDPNIPEWFPVHETGPNTAGAIIVRRFLDQSPTTPLSRPILLLRDLTTGCAVPAREALELVNLVTADRGLYTSTWRHHDQYKAHYEYATSILPRLCFALESVNSPLWLRGAEYVPGINPDGAYLGAQGALPAPGRFIRIRSRLPAMPQIPCSDGCSLTGSEELRYWSISLLAQTQTLISVSDRHVTSDPDGFFTLVIGVGEPPPHVTPENGYTYFDLAQVQGYENLSSMAIRSILPSAGFRCAVQEICFTCSESNSEGGFMGEYGPVVDFPFAEELPPLAEPWYQTQSCGLVPPEVPVDCRTLVTPPAP